MIIFVYAQEQNRGIGFENRLPWHLPNDLKFFKKITMGHTIVMGRKTFESMGSRLLPGRKTVVLTRNSNYRQDLTELTVVTDYQAIVNMGDKEDVMIIGGAEVFKLLLPYADQIIRTQIEATYPCDVFMPEIDEEEWRCFRVEQGVLDEKNSVSHQFEWWRRRTK